MNQLKYVGMDVHKATTVIVILNALGHFQKQVIIKTKADSIRESIKSESGTLHVIFEEGTQSAWLYELIKPLVAEVAVCDVRKHKTGHKGNHADAIDADQADKRDCVAVRGSAALISCSVENQADHFHGAGCQEKNSGCQVRRRLFS